MKIVWKDLPKSQGFFTRRSAIMLTLDTKKAIQFYAPNTKLNLVQYTLFNNAVYFRTESAKKNNLNWAIKADSFSLPNNYLASLAPSRIFLEKKVVSETPSAQKTKIKQKQSSSSKNEGSNAAKQNLIKRLMKHLKRGK